MVEELGDYRLSKMVLYDWKIKQASVATMYRRLKTTHMGRWWRCAALSDGYFWIVSIFMEALMVRIEGCCVLELVKGKEGSN